MTLAVSLVGASRHYQMGENTVRALDALSLEIGRGERVAIMGPSGSGKSTCMNLIGCLDRPTAGRVLVNGEDTAQMGEQELAQLRNRTVGFVFQQFHLLPRMTIAENAGLPLVYAGVRPKERRRRALEALDQVGLADRAHHRPNELSGGQRQRAAIARAIINNPTILLADEPTGALDQATGKTVLDIFDQINRGGTTIIVVTHDPLIGQSFPRVVRLRDGRLDEEC